jgi:hypothetical protein
MDACVAVSAGGWFFLLVSSSLLLFIAIERSVRKDHHDDGWRRDIGTGIGITTIT